MSDHQWRIPNSMIKGLAGLPRNRPIALLLRHSVRGELPPGDAGYALPITKTVPLTDRCMEERLNS